MIGGQLLALHPVRGHRILYRTMAVMVAAWPSGIKRDSRPRNAIMHGDIIQKTETESVSVFRLYTCVTQNQYQTMPALAQLLVTGG
jgi:hypothetical protein